MDLARSIQEITEEVMLKMTVFAHKETGLRDLCLAHTDVRRNPLDTLGDWILTTAHHPGGSSLSH